jgi:hypothetical protein
MRLVLLAWDVGVRLFGASLAAATLGFVLNVAAAMPEARHLHVLVAESAQAGLATKARLG